MLSINDFYKCIRMYKRFDIIDDKHGLRIYCTENQKEEVEEVEENKKEEVKENQKEEVEEIKTI